MLKIDYSPIITKVDAWKMESGKKGLTRQILDMNLKILVVGKDGRGYEKEQWDKSDTFCKGRQSNLLISDNQTRAYSCNPAAQKKLSRDVWGLAD
jgi:hypothetical protein